MATIALQPMAFAKTIGTVSGPFVLDFEEAALQTFLPGAVVTFNEAGYLEEGSGNEDRIVGVVRSKGQNLASAGLGTRPQVDIANANTVFQANLNTTSSRRDVGRAFRIAKSGNIWVVDKASDAGGAALANRRVIVIGHDFSNGQVIGDTNQRVFFQFHPANCALAYTS